MLPKKFWRSLNPFAQRGPGRPLDDIWPVEEFRAILKRQLGRAHRHGHELSVVVFDGIGAGCTQDLRSVLYHRMNSTGEAGWLDGQHIGVILLDTSVERAWKVANDICQRVASTGTLPACRVYHIECP
jgi:hypothetical protein